MLAREDVKKVVINLGYLALAVYCGIAIGISSSGCDYYKYVPDWHHGDCVLVEVRTEVEEYYLLDRGDVTEYYVGWTIHRISDDSFQSAGVLFKTKEEQHAAATRWPVNQKDKCENFNIWVYWHSETIRCEQVRQAKAVLWALLAVAVTLYLVQKLL